MGAFHVIAMIIGIFAVLIIFTIAFMVVSDNIVPIFRTHMPDARGNQTIQIIETSLFWVPMILIVGLILYAFAAAQKREYDTTRKPVFMMGGNACQP